MLDVVTGGRADGRAARARPSADAGAAGPIRRRPRRPSANRFGRVSPTTAEHVRADLGDDVDFVLDGGPCPVGVESTIVDCTVDPPQVLRPGGISAEEIEALLEMTLGARRRAEPGARHARLALRTAMPGGAGRFPQRGRWRSPTNCPAPRSSTTTIWPHYAHTLFARLRDADDRGVDTVVAVLPPASGLGHAIRDRLIKACRGARAN